MSGALTCPSCGPEIPAGFKFCGQCATPLAVSAGATEERKVVTTLFCDLVGFTAMSEAADPEDVDALLGKYFARATKVIESHGGVVEKFIGDAVVGVFGVPVGTRVELGPDVHTQSARCILSVWQGVARQTVSRLGVMRPEARQFRNVVDG
jgi:class 3 adenylate cyclase